MQATRGDILKTSVPTKANNAIKQNIQQATIKNILSLDFSMVKTPNTHKVKKTILASM